MNSRVWVEIPLRNISLMVGADGKLHASPASKVSEELRQAISNHKDALIDWLSNPRPTLAHCPTCKTVRKIELAADVPGWLHWKCQHGYVLPTDPRILSEVAGGTIRYA